MTTQTAKAPSRDRSNSVLIDLGDLRPILRKIATADAHKTHDNLNMSRTVRRLIHEEAVRLGILPETP